MYEIDKLKFGSFVAQLRKEKGLTQKELASKLYISDKAVSKWETGVSIPDVGLLVPLAEQLEVTVTELLECRRIDNPQPMETEQVEQLLQKAIRYSDEEKPDTHRKPRVLVYLACVGTACMELACLHLGGYPAGTWSDALWLSLVFGILFGAYFMFLAKPRLPAYHDENQIYGMMQGPFRMNIPGLAFNNRNWPHILRVGRLWSMSYMVGYPAVYYILYELLPEFWQRWEAEVMLCCILGGLFIPMYIVGKKYET